jgi:hypothetical protein
VVEPRPNRRLAAILAADVVGFSKMFASIVANSSMVLVSNVSGSIEIDIVAGLPGFEGYQTVVRPLTQIPCKDEVIRALYRDLLYWILERFTVSLELP